jgi:hypothetical protein
LAGYVSNEHPGDGLLHRARAALVDRQYADVGQ